MNKEIIHVFYDPSINAVKVEIMSNDGTYTSSTSWNDILVSLYNNKEFKKICSKNGIVVEYKDLIIKIDDWQKCAELSSTINRFIMSVIGNQQKKRLKKVCEFNEQIDQMIGFYKPSKNVDIPGELQSTLRRRHEEAYRASMNQEQVLISDKAKEKNSPKVKRKNKFFGIITSVVAGSLIVTALSNPPQVKTNDLQVSPSEPEISSVLEPMVTTTINTDMSTSLNETDFKTDLNIDDLIQDRGIKIDLEDNVNLNYEDRSNTDKALITEAKYGDLIRKYAKKCGIDPKIVLGIATQESGNHELGLRSGSKGGLMQIEIDYWRGREITYYDFDDKESYVIKIDDNIDDVENNILIGCAILQNELKTFNYNILLAIQSYNEGYSNMNKILDATSMKTGLNKTDIINDDNCLEWLKYTDVVNQGDPNYVNNVLSWTGYGYSFYELVCQKENGDIKVSSTIPVTEREVKAI